MPVALTLSIGFHMGAKPTFKANCKLLKYWHKVLNVLNVKTVVGNLGVQGQSDWAKGILFKHNNLIITFRIIFLPCRYVLESNCQTRLEVINITCEKCSQQYYTFLWSLMVTDSNNNIAQMMFLKIFLQWPFEEQYRNVMWNLQAISCPLFPLKISEKPFSMFNLMHSIFAVAVCNSSIWLETNAELVRSNSLVLT